MKQTRFKAMTLTELLVVLGIMGILILVAYPIVTPLFQRARSQEAKLNLAHLASLQKVYFLEHTRYSNDLKSVGFEQEILDSEGGKAFYQISISEASPSDFRATATAVADFDGDGVLNVWEINKAGIPREIVED